MPYHADILAFDATGSPLLAVEVKAKLKAPPTWAAEMRRNLIAHGVTAAPKYFLLAMPDRFYLWANAGSELLAIPPSFEIDPRDLLGPYFSAAGIGPQDISEESLELIVGAWLGALLGSRDLPTTLRRHHPWLSQLFEELKGGRIAYEVAA